LPEKRWLAGLEESGGAFIGGAVSCAEPLEQRVVTPGESAISSDNNSNPPGLRALYKLFIWGVPRYKSGEKGGVPVEGLSKAW